MYQFYIEKERDPIQQKLEQDVFAKMKEYSTVPNEPIQKTKRFLPCDNKVLTPEEALKELQELEAKGII